MKQLTIIAALLAACGTCPTSSSGVDTRADWQAERDAACAAVEGCDVDFMAQVPVYEDALEEVRDVCKDSNARGCFCVGTNCPGVIMLSDADVQMPGCTSDAPNCWYTQSDIVLHEYMHAALHSIGHETADHPDEFTTALWRARAAL